MLAPTGASNRKPPPLGMGYITFVTISKDTEDVDMAPCLPHELELNKERVLDKFDLLISNKLREADELRQKKEYFVKNFGKFFETKE